MVMRSLTLLTLLVTLLVGCGRNTSTEDTGFPWFRKKGVTRCNNGVIYERLVYHTQHLALKYKKERRLKLEDSNYWYEESLNKVRLDFSSMALVDFCDARFLLVDLVEDLIAAMEADNELMTQLEQRYISPNIFEVYIDFKSYMGKVDMDYVGWISLEKGCANYYAFDMRTNQLDWWHRRSETYVESRAVVNATRQAEKDWEEAHKPEEEALKEERFRYDI